jgi:hypothetical protein
MRDDRAAAALYVVAVSFIPVTRLNRSGDGATRAAAVAPTAARRQRS